MAPFRGPNLKVSPMDNNQITHQMWIFTGGAILVLLQSLVEGLKRKWFQLIIGCIFGGLGSTAAFAIWGTSPYIAVIAGVSAVIVESIVTGVVHASHQFAEQPFSVIGHFARMFLPTFGQSIGNKEQDHEGLK